MKPQSFWYDCVDALRAGDTAWSGNRDGYCNRVDLDLFGWFYCKKRAGHRGGHRWISILFPPTRRAVR